MSTRRTAAVGAVLALVLVFAACGGAASKRAATSASSTLPPSVPAATTGTGPNPNGPEVNPSGDIPDTQVYVAYSDATEAFSLKVPEGWARTDANGAVSFTDKLNTVRIESKAAAAAPTVDSARRDELPAIQSSAANYQAGIVTALNRKAGTAVLITYKADAAADPVTGKVVHDAIERYEFWRNGTEVVLTLSGPDGADNVDPWRIVTDSFGWKA